MTSNENENRFLSSVYDLKKPQYVVVYQKFYWYKQHVQESQLMNFQNSVSVNIYYLLLYSSKVVGVKTMMGIIDTYIFVHQRFSFLMS